jgi:hypothetical protein
MSIFAANKVDELEMGRDSMIVKYRLSWLGMVRTLYDIFMTGSYITRIWGIGQIRKPKENSNN